MPSQRIDTPALDAAIAWITREVIGNETYQAIPASLRPLIAQRMVDDAFMGWPTVEEANDHLDNWTWI